MAITRGIKAHNSVIPYETLLLPSSIIIEPRILVSSGATIDVPIDKRKCRFPNERKPDQILFKDYSHNGCIFECMWKQAKDHCLCIPWHYPHLDNGSKVRGVLSHSFHSIAWTRINISQVCDSYGNVCWSYMLRDGANLMKCECEFECEKITYSHYSHKNELKPEQCVSNLTFGWSVFLLLFIWTYLLELNKARICKNKFVHSKIHEGNPPERSLETIRSVTKSRHF